MYYRKRRSKSTLEVGEPKKTTSPKFNSSSWKLISLHLLGNIPFWFLYNIPSLKLIACTWKCKRGTIYCPFGFRSLFGEQNPTGNEWAKQQNTGLQKSTVGFFQATKCSPIRWVLGWDDGKLMEVDGSTLREMKGKVTSKYMGFPFQKSWYVLGDVCSPSGSWFLAYTLQLHWHHWKLVGGTKKHEGVVQMIFLFRWNQPLEFSTWVSPTTVSRVHKVAWGG